MTTLGGRRLRHPRGTPPGFPDQQQSTQIRFRYFRIDTLPSQAWCARRRNRASVVEVFHGRGVETFPNSFAEGAWDGPFEDGSLACATVIAGTGAWLDGAGFHFTGSTDQLSPVFSLSRPGEFFVSNSPVFALEAAGESLDPVYPFYTYDLLRFWRQGLYCPAGNLRTASPSTYSVHFSTIVSIRPDGSVRYSAHPVAAAPLDFDSYRALLDAGVSQVFANAASPNRFAAYRPIAAISRGYDSCATAALASRAGCTEAFTFRDAQAPEPEADSGEENAKQLHMDCVVRDRWRYLELEGRTEPEFAMVARASQNPLAAFEDVLPSRILVAGYFGDNIWDPKRSAFCIELSKPWIRTAGGLSQIEFRLRTGYLLFAPAYIGARNNREIHAIAVSDSLRPWWIGGSYDRPLARRLAEEAGLSRDSFGITKMYTAHSHLCDETAFSPAGWNEYRSFVRTSHASIAAPVYNSWRFLVGARHFLWRHVGCHHYRYVPPSFWQRRFSFLLNNHPRLLDWDTMFTFQWAAATLGPRYRFSEVPEHSPSQPRAGVSPALSI